MDKFNPVSQSLSSNQRLVIRNNELYVENKDKNKLWHWVCRHIILRGRYDKAQILQKMHEVSQGILEPEKHSSPENLKMFKANYQTIVQKADDQNLKYETTCIILRVLLKRTHVDLEESLNDLDGLSSPREKTEALSAELEALKKEDFSYKAYLQLYSKIHDLKEKISESPDEIEDADAIVEELEKLEQEISESFGVFGDDLDDLDRDVTTCLGFLELGNMVYSRNFIDRVNNALPEDADPIVLKEEYRENAKAYPQLMQQLQLRKAAADQNTPTTVRDFIRLGLIDNDSLDDFLKENAVKIAANIRRNCAEFIEE